METFSLTALISALLGSPAAIAASDSPGPIPVTYWDAAAVEASSDFVVVLDPGHDPPDPGALSTVGIREVFYNDALVRRIAILLRDRTGVTAYVSRRPHETLGLADRATRIAALRPNLVVSVHHDSVKPQFISFETRGELEIPTCEEFAGYSLFAQAKGAHRKRSQRFAKNLAARYQRLGLSRTTYHAMKIPGENRRWIDQRLGIHAGDYLYLLRKIDRPVVLVESGFLVNSGDERRLRDPDHTYALARAIADAVSDQAADHGG